MNVPQKTCPGRKAAWFLWYLPIILVIVGSSWSRGRVWLWVPAFVVMGMGCLANAARCGRIHCYVDRTAVPPRSGFRRPLRVSSCAAPSRSVPPRRLRHVLPRSMCRDSVRQIPKGIVILAPQDQPACGRRSLANRLAADKSHSRGLWRFRSELTSPPFC